MRIDTRKIKIEKQNRCYKCYNQIGRISCSPEASSIMAKYLTEYAQENNISELHFLTGIGHEDEIAYFLKYGGIK